MKIYKRTGTIQKHLDRERRAGHTIGFIPTMGALHEGHMSLVKASTLQNDITVVSIFVNPTQFNQKEDLVKYPRNLERDAELLSQTGTDYIFAPAVSQVYPKHAITSVDLDIDKFIRRMEGPNRPGHFEGVIQVVNRFLKLLEPHHIYMGQKDFQQFSIIGHLIERHNLPTRLKVCPIIREKNGLAMSSRNERLSETVKEKAGLIYQNLIFAKENLGKVDVPLIEARAMENLEQDLFRPEYFEIFDGHSFERVSNPENHELVVAGTAVWAGSVRLIDNMILKGTLDHE